MSSELQRILSDWNKERTVFVSSIANLKLDLPPDQVHAAVLEVKRHYQRYKAFLDGQNPDDPAVAKQYGLLASGEKPAGWMRPSVVWLCQRTIPRCVGSLKAIRW